MQCSAWYSIFTHRLAALSPYLENYSSPTRYIRPQSTLLPDVISSRCDFQPM